MSTTLSVTLTPTTHSFNEWRRVTNKSILSIGDLSTIYTSDGVGGDNVAAVQSKYALVNVASASWTNNTVTFVCSTEHNLISNGVLNDTVTVSGVSPSGYNGTYTLYSAIDDNTFSAVQNTTLGLYVSGGVVSYQTTDVITVLNDLNTRKVKRTGDSITYLNVTNATVASSTTTGALIVTGGTGIGGKLYVGGDTAVGANKVTMAASTGNTNIAGTLNVVGDYSVASTKFTVAASTGNTVVVGTLNVTGLTTLGVLNLGTALGVSYGGIGLSAYPTANYMLGVNAAGTAYEGKSITSTGGTVNVTYPSAGILNIETSAVMPGSLVTPTDVRIGQQLLIGAAATSGPTTYNPLSPSANVSSLEIRPGFGVSYNWLVRVTTDTAGATPALTMDTAGVLKILTSTAATNTTSGALQVTGGVGINGTLYATAIQNTPIGAGTANTGAFTTLSATTLTLSSTLSTTADLSVTTDSVLGTSVGKLTTFGLDCVITTYRGSTTSAAANQVMVTGSASTYQSVEYIIQAKDTIAGYVHTEHILAASDGSNVDITAFGAVAVNAHYLATYNVDVSGGNLRLLVTPNQTNLTNYKITCIYTKA